MKKERKQKNNRFMRKCEHPSNPFPKLTIVMTLRTTVKSPHTNTLVSNMVLSSKIHVKHHFSYDLHHCSKISEGMMKMKLACWTFFYQHCRNLKFFEEDGFYNPNLVKQGKQFNWEEGLIIADISHDMSAKINAACVIWKEMADLH